MRINTHYIICFISTLKHFATEFVFNTKILVDLPQCKLGKIKCMSNIYFTYFIYLAHSTIIT